jgi:hypothetical protein
MSAGITQRLSLLRFDFDGLYIRHLGRHSQLGINIAHLIALYGIWFGIYAVIGQGVLLLGLPSAWPVLVPMALAYLGTISMNSPFSVTVATAAFVALLVASVLALPALPLWSFIGFLALLPVSYKVQAYSHKVWTIAADMSEHNKRFPPGRDLNIILLFYEVPICLKYLLFCPGDWRR